ncbi:MAG TPA: DUF296 domain-containing protein [Thermoleophilia bacterium]|nr:DUF296 domain-containing protein [Thermoleophilia bacterium]HQG03261.1 DUF296 domain-containing protein [Thermoleophilia bacterium]HQJ98038.1 DUF296 domain-containing protein [Thermoleophilia bacterium]
MPSRESSGGRRFVARLPFGADLLAAIADLADEHRVLVGEVRAVGALQRARLAWYDQVAHVYRERDFDQRLELVSLLGNVSRRDGATAVHAHAAVAGEDGRCFGGHVVEGCTVFAGEVFLDELTGGEPLERAFDDETGLSLWRNVRTDREG